MTETFVTIWIICSIIVAVLATMHDKDPEVEQEEKFGFLTGAFCAALGPILIFALIITGLLDRLGVIESEDD